MPQRTQRDTDPAESARFREQVLADNYQAAIESVGRFEGQGVEREDLEQVAMLALVQAIRRYLPEDGEDFGVFAARMITGDLTRYVREHGQLVPPPREPDELDRDVREIARELQQDLRRDPTTAEIARVMGLTSEDLPRPREAGPGDHNGFYDTSVTLISLRSTTGIHSRGEPRRSGLSATAASRRLGGRVLAVPMQMSTMPFVLIARLRAGLRG